MNGMDLYKQISDNKIAVNEHAEQLTTIKTNLEGLEDSMTTHLAQCVVKDNVLDEKKEIFSNLYEIYNAEYVQTELNSINSTIEGLVKISAEGGVIINKLSTISGNITYGTSDLGEEEFLCFNNNPLATQNYVIKSLEDLAANSIFSLEQDEYDATDTTKAVCGKIVNDAINIAIDGPIATNINEAINNIPGRYETYSDIPYINFGSDTQGILYGSYPDITNSRICFAIGNGLANGAEHNLFCIDDDGVYHNDKKLALDVDKVNINNNTSVKISYENISSMELSTTLILENSGQTITFNGFNQSLNLSDLVITGLQSLSFIDDTIDDNIAVSMGTLRTYITPENKMNNFGTVTWDSENERYCINSDALKINDITFTSNGIDGLGDLDQTSAGHRAVNKNYVDKLENNLSQIFNNKQNKLANETYVDEVLVSAMFTIPMYIETPIDTNITNQSIINVEYLNNSLNTKQDKIAEINNGALTLNNSNNMITNLLVPDITEEVDGTTAANKNYVDTTIQSLREYITELEGRILALENGGSVEEETE